MMAIVGMKWECMLTECQLVVKVLRLTDPSHYAM